MQWWEWVWRVCGAAGRAVWLHRSIPELSGMKAPPPLFSKVKWDCSQSDQGQSCGRVLTSTALPGWRRERGVGEASPSICKAGFTGEDLFTRWKIAFLSEASVSLLSRGCLVETPWMHPAGFMELSVLPGQFRVSKHQKHQTAHRGFLPKNAQASCNRAEGRSVWVLVVEPEGASG